MPIPISTSFRLLQAVARVIVEQSYESFPRTKTRALLALSRPSPFSRDRCARSLGPSRGEFRTQQEETACARATWLRNGGKKRPEKEEKKLLDGTWRKYLIGGTVTVHLAVTSGIPLPVCGETLQGSFTFSHRFSKMAHLTSFALSTSSPSLSFRGSPMSKLLPSYNSYLTDHSRFSLGWSTPVKVTARSTPLLISRECSWVRRPSSPCLFRSCLLRTRHRFRNFIARSIQRSIIQPL